MKQSRQDNQVHDYYAAQELSKQRMEFLLEQESLYRYLEQGKAPAVALHRLHKPILFFSALVLVLLTLIVFRSFQSPVEQLVAEEIALNHDKNLPSDFSGENLTLLGKAMPKLDFELIASEKINAARLQLIGTRYCSIQGNIAAQIKYRTADNRRVTVYQTKPLASLDHTGSLTVIQGDRKIELWQEQGRLMGIIMD